MIEVRSVIKNMSSKNVSFSDKIVSHYLCKWNFAYREARKGKWKQVVCDRLRFQKKVEFLSVIISPIMEKKHRYRIYLERLK